MIKQIDSDIAWFKD